MTQLAMFDNDGATERPLSAYDPRAPYYFVRPEGEEIEFDYFAGGGGASEGYRMALGRDPAEAVNHNIEALAIHKANHPGTRHHRESVWKIDPVTIAAGRPIGCAWFSPDCTDFSKAKGGKPVSKKIRGLAWVVVRVAKAVRPRIIKLENVEEFEGWGPLLKGTDKRDPKRAGKTFRAFVAKLRRFGYVVEWRQLRGCDYGAPTTRKRLFLIARCDGEPIVWPKPTHGPNRAHPYRVAADCIDWSIPCPSIFLTKAEAKALGFSRIKRPLVDNTLRRVARGTWKFVINNPRPFIVQFHSPKSDGDDRLLSIDGPLGTRTQSNRFGLVAPTLIQMGYGEDKHRNGGAGQPPRVLDLHAPLGTVVGTGKHALVASFLAKNFGGHETPGSAMVAPFDTVTGRDHHSLVASSIIKLKGTAKDGQSIEMPLHTVQGGGYHYAEVRAFLTKYYRSADSSQALDRPLDTVTPNDRFALVTVAGAEYAIADIGQRMLVPRELARAQGFRDSYALAVPCEYTVERKRKGKLVLVTITKTLSAEAQTSMIGNSVNPQLAAALIGANYQPTRVARTCAA